MSRFKIEIFLLFSREKKTQKKCEEGCIENRLCKGAILLFIL